MKKRNPIAKAVKHIKPKTVPDKRREKLGKSIKNEVKSELEMEGLLCKKNGAM